MADQHRVAVIIGSLRADSISRKLAQALIARAPDTLIGTIVEIGALPLYNEDLEADCPPAWSSFREEIARSAALLFVTPEYNRSVPGALKNAIDVGSRPYGRASLVTKPAAIVSHSPGNAGGFGANHALRQSLVFLDIPAMQQPEAYIAQSKAMFDEAGRMIKEDSEAFLRGFMTAFARWVTRFV